MRDLRRWFARHRSRASLRGQSLVEFALVLPLLLVLFLGIADFGRVFAAGITLEAAARNAAEVVAEEYRRNPPDGVYADLTVPAPTPAVSSYYQALHDLAAAVACRESGRLDNSTYDAGTDRCDVDSGTGEQLPIISVCIHDGADPLCDQPGFGATVPSAGQPDPCDLRNPASNEMVGYTQGTENSRYVEVRICYRFSMLMRLPPLPIGDIWLRKARVFTVAYFPPPPTPTAPPEPSAPPASSLPPTPEPTPSETPTPTPSESPTPTPTATPTPTPPPEPQLPDTPTPSPTPAGAQP